MAQCDQPHGYVLDNTDCDDTNAAFKPDATDIAGSGLDLNCDGNYLWYVDIDGDGFGINETVTSSSATLGSGESDNMLDCYDQSNLITDVCANVWNGESWSEGSPPTETEFVLIDATYSFSTNGNFAAENLIVSEGIELLVDGSATLIINGDVQNNGTFIVNSGASLITYAGNTISSNIMIQRNTRYAGGKYSFVGSPIVLTEEIQTTLLGPIVYAYDETKPYGENEGLNRWVWQNAKSLIPAKGYAQANKQLIEFIGRPNDGTITIPGTYTGTPNDMINDANEGWNLVANPFPAAINVGAFLAENDNLVGAVYIWDDNGSDTGRGSNSDYIVANAMEAINTQPTPAGGASRYNQHLGSSQGFFVKLIGNGDDQISFTEAMRVSGSNGDDNFFRKKDKKIPFVRVNLTDDSGLFKQMIVGWVNGISDDQWNRIYDAPVFNPNMDFGLYSLKMEKSLAIQGISNQKEEIPIGYNVQKSGTYRIELDTKDFSNQTLYLKDKSMDLVVNLSESYSFTTEAGVFKDRFVLLISPEKVQGVGAPVEEIYEFNNILYINPNIQYDQSKTYKIFNLSGKLVFSIQVENTTKVTLTLIPGIYVVTDGLTSRSIIIE